MADFPGLTFSPTGDQTKNPNGSPSNGPQGYAPIQDAIRTLRFSIPHFGGATSPIPQGLLMGAGSGGLDLQGILAALFGSQPQRGIPGGGSAPIPNVYPGGQPQFPGGGSPPSDPSLPRPGQTIPKPPYQQPAPAGGYGPLVMDPPPAAPSAPMGGPMAPGGPGRDWMGGGFRNQS